MYKYAFIKPLLYPAIAMRRIIRSNRNHQRHFEVLYTNLCNLLSGDPIVKVDTFQGIFCVDVRSDLFRRLLFEKSYENDLIPYCMKYVDKNRDVIDVGANIGFFTVLFAKNIINKKVLAIEPTKNALRRLSNNIKINQVRDSVIIYEGVVSNSIGVTEIKTIEGKEEYSTLGVLKHPSVTMDHFVLEKVNTTTVDELVAQHSLSPGFMKVDVEGVEHLVFDGAKSVLNKHRPVILTELNDYLLKENGASSVEVVNLIKQNEYNIIDPLNPAIPFGRMDFGNILCIPKELT